MTAPTSPQIIIDELRRQVDHQVTAADAPDTKAMAIFAGTAAVAAFIAPRVTVTTPAQGLTSAVALAFLLGALVCLMLGVRPRIGGFSNGPDVGQLAARVDEEPGDLELDLVPSFVDVRNRNEAYLKSKGDWTVWALRCLIVTTGAMGAMVGVGAIR